MDNCFDFEDRTNNYVYTIDPETSKDFDDAFGIKVVDGMIVLSIYI